MGNLCQLWQSWSPLVNHIYHNQPMKIMVNPCLAWKTMVTMVKHGQPKSTWSNMVNVMVNHNGLPFSTMANNGQASLDMLNHGQPLWS